MLIFFSRIFADIFDGNRDLAASRTRLKIQVRVQLFLLSIVMVLFFQNLFGLLTLLSLHILKVSFKISWLNQR